MLPTQFREKSFRMNTRCKRCYSIIPAENNTIDCMIDYAVVMWCIAIDNDSDLLPW